MAMVQGAVYDAVNSIARGYESYLDVPRAPRSASQAAATATAAHDVLVSVLNQAPLTATFTAAVRQSILTVSTYARTSRSRRRRAPTAPRLWRTASTPATRRLQP